MKKFDYDKYLDFIKERRNESDNLGMTMVWNIVDEVVHEFLTEDDSKKVD